MLMTLLWSLIATPVTWLLTGIPAPPDPVSLDVPWPAWLPSWPLTFALTTVLGAGALFLIVRFVRWVYSLVPVAQ